MMLTAALLWSFEAPRPGSNELAAFVSRPDQSYSWAPATVDGRQALSLVSQSWQGAEWRHDVVVIRPDRAAKLGAAIIEVTGWEPNETDYLYGKALADASGLPVAILFHVPNQPLFGREEDDLVAHTFEKYFETGDPSWPLLFPMVKSVKAAMDALVDWSEGSDDPLSKFVVTGASKRGWTTWLVGALGDPRVVGIAPTVFDNLDFASQLAQQRAYWGGYSPMIADYTDRGLQDMLDTDRGRSLVQMVDPYFYLGRTTAPTLVLTGTNDPYWTVDSTQVYWPRMTMPKWTLAVPNAGHDMGDKSWWAPSVGLFARACADGTPLPRVTSRLRLDESSWEMRVDCAPGPSSYKVWRATAEDMRFDTAEWSVVDSASLDATDGHRGIWVSGGRAAGRNSAVLVELLFSTERGDLRLTTLVYVVPKG